MSQPSQLSKKRRIKLLRKRCPYPEGSKLKRTLRVVSRSNEETKGEPFKEEEYDIDINNMLLYYFKESPPSLPMPQITVDLSKASEKGLAE